MGDNAVHEIVTQLSSLQELRLSYCKSLTNASMEFMIRYGRSLRFLNLQRCTGIQDLGFQLLRQEEFRMNGLAVLLLPDCSFLTDDTIYSIAVGCPQLRVLNLSFCCALSPLALEHLAERAKMVRRGESENGSRKEEGNCV